MILTVPQWPSSYCPLPRFARLGRTAPGRSARPDGAAGKGAALPPAERGSRNLGSALKTRPRMQGDDGRRGWCFPHASAGTQGCGAFGKAGACGVCGELELHSMQVIRAFLQPAAAVLSSKKRRLHFYLRADSTL